MIYTKNNRLFSIIGLGVMLILSTSFIGPASAQQTNTTTKVFGIKITSPSKGQQITLSRNNLTVTGVASYNSTMNCNVYVIVNNVKPYHKALPVANTNNNNNNTNDYSSWKYNLPPTQGVIKTGTNKITSKLTCQRNNTGSSNSSTPLAKFYSVNFTGTPTTTTKQQEQIPKQSTNSSGSFGTHNLASNYNNKTGPIVKKQKTALPINSTNIAVVKSKRISLGVGENKTKTANVTAPAGNRSQSTISAATLLSTAGIMSSSSNRGYTQATTGSTDSDSNTNHGHEKSDLSGASASGTTTDNHNHKNLVGKNLVSRKQQSDTSTANEPVHKGFISKNMTAHNNNNNNNNNIKKLSTHTNLSSGSVQSESSSQPFGTPEKSSSNNNSPIITSSQVSNHPTLPQVAKVRNESERVYIPSPSHTNTATSTVTTSNYVVIPSTKTNNSTNPLNQSVGPIQKPQVPNGKDKIPFVMATPMHHITNGTTSPASDQPISVTLALNLVDKTRVVGYSNDIPVPSH